MISTIAEVLADEDTPLKDVRIEVSYCLNDRVLTRATEILRAPVSPDELQLCMEFEGITERDRDAVWMCYFSRYDLSHGGCFTKHPIVLWPPDVLPTEPPCELSDLFMLRKLVCFVGPGLKPGKNDADIFYFADLCYFDDAELLYQTGATVDLPQACAVFMPPCYRRKGSTHRTAATHRRSPGRESSSSRLPVPIP